MVFGGMFLNKHPGLPRLSGSKRKHQTAARGPGLRFLAHHVLLEKLPGGGSDSSHGSQACVGAGSSGKEQPSTPGLAWAPSSTSTREKVPELEPEGD